VQRRCIGPNCAHVFLTQISMSPSIRSRNYFPVPASIAARSFARISREKGRICRGQVILRESDRCPGRKLKWKVHRNARIYGFNISSPSLFFSLSPARREADNATTTSDDFYLVKLVSWSTRVQCENKIKKRRNSFGFRNYERMPRSYAPPTHPGNNPLALDLPLYVRAVERCHAVETSSL